MLFKNRRKDTKNFLILQEIAHFFIIKLHKNAYFCTFNVHNNAIFNQNAIERKMTSMMLDLYVLELFHNLLYGIIVAAVAELG